MNNYCFKNFPDEDTVSKENDEEKNKTHTTKWRGDMTKRLVKSNISIIIVPNAVDITIVIHGGQWGPVARGP